jgi:hypothetical protein
VELSNTLSLYQSVNNITKALVAITEQAVLVHRAPAIILLSINFDEYIINQ